VILNQINQSVVITMRGCAITGNRNGIYLFDGAIADFGTAASPGNNTFQGNAHVGLSIDGSSGARLITAVGNTWQLNTQGANAQGKYGTQTIAGPVAAVDGNNYHINSGWSLQF